MTRQAHWIPGNMQERMPPRMVALDTESRFNGESDLSIQSWRTGSAIRWRNDLPSGDNAEGKAFRDPCDLWSWITDYCRDGIRTVVWAHNLGHDVRISRAFEILPQLGFELEWCNLDRNVSAMTWRSDRGTLVMADTWTWIPLPLNAIAPLAGLVKFQMPPDAASEDSWRDYCMRDTEIVYRVVSTLMRFIEDEHLGNWQPTGAGMSYATWRHRFMEHKVLAHSDDGALTAERLAMHTGRAEAWRHGEIKTGTWTEVDMRNAYLTIGAECDLPRKLRSEVGRLTNRDYDRIASRYRILALCDIRTSTPMAPYRTRDRIIWPEGTFQSWLWDTEVNSAIRYGASVSIRRAYLYARDPILRSWADWVRDVLRNDAFAEQSVPRTWLKHCSRALIGRLSLRTPAWEVFGENPEGITGITHMTDPDTGRTYRLMHVGNRTLIETERREGRDSLPQVTGWIMAECRTRLWDGMNAAGLDNLAHVDTDSVLINSAGLKGMRSQYGADFERLWQIKGSWRHLDIYGPRCYFRGGVRVASGIPRKAERVAEGVYAGERWSALSADLAQRGGVVVTTRPGKWTMRRSDPRRGDAAGVAGRTVSYVVDAADSISKTSPSGLAPGS